MMNSALTTDNLEHDHLDWLHAIAPVPRIINHEAVDRHWVEPMRVIYDHELMLFGKGRGVVRIAGELFSCESDSFLIIPPGCWESSHAVVAPWQRHWVHFDWVYHPAATPLPISTLYPQQPQRHVLHLPPACVPRRVLHGSLHRPRQVFDLFHRLEQRWQRGSAHARATCRGLLLELLLELLDTQDQLPQDIDQSALLTGRLRGALEALSTQPMSAMPSMQEYLGQFGCSYAHAERLFRHTFGLSPVGYVHALRMERARLLLRDTAEPISVIAYQVGIDDPAYFSRVFTRYTGISPSAFRRQQG